MSHSRDNLKRQIAEQVSRLAALDQSTAATVAASEEAERAFLVANQSKSDDCVIVPDAPDLEKNERIFLDANRAFEVQSREIALADQAYEAAKKRAHDGIRRKVLLFLACLTCAWLAVVVLFVGWTALSPTVQDREKLFLLQTEAASKFPQAVTATAPVKVQPANVIPQSSLRAVSPHYCPILFHLSDTVLVTFITSTTVAVLGLFLTAARWLYGTPSAPSSEKNQQKHASASPMGNGNGQN